MGKDGLEDWQHRARAEQLLHWFIKGSNGPAVPWVARYMTQVCPDCGKTVTEPDGVHCTAGLWRVFTIVITCKGRRLIPVEESARWRGES